MSFVPSQHRLHQRTLQLREGQTTSCSGLFASTLYTKDLMIASLVLTSCLLRVAWRGTAESNPSSKRCWIFCGRSLRLTTSTGATCFRVLWTSSDMLFVATTGSDAVGRFVAAQILVGDAVWPERFPFPWTNWDALRVLTAESVAVRALEELLVLLVAARGTPAVVVKQLMLQVAFEFRGLQYP